MEIKLEGLHNLYYLYSPIKKEEDVFNSLSNFYFKKSLVALRVLVLERIF